MPVSGATLIPAYAPGGRTGKSAAVLVGVLLLHAALAAAVQDAAQGPRPLVAPADPVATVRVLIVPDREDARARLADLVAAPLPLPAPAWADPGASAEPPGRQVRDARADARYLPAAKLDIGPLPAGAPNFAEVTRRTLAIGRVRLRVYVSAFGLPDRVEILGLPLDADFAQALRQALEQTTFLPGRLGGHDVAAYVDYEFQSEVVVLPPPANLRSS